MRSSLKDEGLGRGRGKASEYKRAQ